MKRNNLSLSRLQLAVLVLTLFLSVIALYAGSLFAPLVFDDSSFFDNPANIVKYSHFSLELRWLPYASLAGTVTWLGLDIFWLRLGNVVLHAANATTLFFLLRRLFQVTLTPLNAADNLPLSPSWFAFFGALIFALHPIAVYGVAYLIQRSTLMDYYAGAGIGCWLPCCFIWLLSTPKSTALQPLG